MPKYFLIAKCGMLNSESISMILIGNTT